MIILKGIALIAIICYACALGSFFTTFAENPHRVIRNTWRKKDGE